jgi:4'-phosphopantetheinyl transferase
MLASDHIHAWFGRLPMHAGGYDLRTLLSEDERRRAAQFRSEVHGKEFVAARGMLRLVLSRYIRSRPEELTFRYGQNGKPELANGTLHFNLSHSGHRAFLAVSSKQPLGVDLERIRAKAANARIAAQVFSSSETQTLAALPNTRFTEAFFKGWTRKEAFVKALGDGLSYPLDSFSVSLGEPARIVHIDRDPTSATQWSLHHLVPEDGYIAAIATRQRFSQVSVMNFPASLRDEPDLYGSLKRET